MPEEKWERSLMAGNRDSREVMGKGSGKRCLEKTRKPTQKVACWEGQERLLTELDIINKNKGQQEHERKQV